MVIDGLKGYFEEHDDANNIIFGSKKDKYLTIIFTSKHQKLLYKEILKKINKNINRNYVKIKFESTDKLSLNILVNISALILVVRYQRVYLNTCWYDQLYNGIQLKDTVRLYNKTNDMKVHNVRYENGGFYLTIDNLRGYFNFNNNLGTLTMLFDDINQQNKYHKVWKDIFKIINGGHGELKLHEKIRLYYNDLPIKQVFKIHSITAVIKSLIEKNNKFYLELSVNHCLYKL